MSTLRWDGPKVTDVVTLGGGWSPKPTSPPDLAKRQDVDVHSPYFCRFADDSSDE